MIVYQAVLGSGILGWLFSYPCHHQVQSLKVHRKPRLLMEFLASQQVEGMEIDVPTQDEKILFTDVCGLPRCMVSQHLKKASLSMCSACKEVAYCCKEHQVEHFKEGGHKIICKGSKDKSPLTFNECYEKASKFHQTGQYRSAVTFYAAMLELTEKTLGIFHPQVQKLLEQLIFCYKQLGKFNEVCPSSFHSFHSNYVLTSPHIRLSSVFKDTYLLVRCFIRTA